MTYRVTEARYRFAEDGEIPPGRVVTIVDEPGVTTVVVRPGHATSAFLAAIQREQTSMLALAEWVRLEDTAEAAAHPERLIEATWRLEPDMPTGILCMPFEEPGRHTWLIRPGEASEELVREMSEMLTALVRSGVWVQRWNATDTRSNR
jgi:hypothetical protein